MKNNNGKVQVGDTAYIVENGSLVRKVAVLRIAGGFYTVRLDGCDAMIRLKRHRLYSTEEEAMAALPVKIVKKNEFWMH